MEKENERAKAAMLEAQKLEEEKEKLSKEISRQKVSILFGDCSKKQERFNYEKKNSSIT